MILDYSTFLENKDVQGISGKIHPTKTELFFEKRGWCPFCDRSTSKVYSKASPYNDLNTGFYMLTEAWSCSSCGWWEMEYLHADDWVYERYIRRAILRSFEPSDIELPVQTLRKYLKEQPNLIYELHPIKMERLVQAVFGEFFDCEVVHCGKSHDGGIDLILINSEQPSVIQVKRRAKPDSVESVNTVRNLLGAMLLQQRQHAIVVTTADHFSSEAQQAAKTAVDLNIVKSFDLIDANRFLNMLNLIYSGREELWRAHLK